MKNVCALRVDCISDPLVGQIYYYAYDQKKCCKALGIPEKDWMKYVLNHIFSASKGWSNNLQVVFLDKAVNKMTVTINDGRIIELKKMYF